MDEAYELALAREGEAASGRSEDQWVAWEETLALTSGAAAKKQLVAATFVPTTSAFQYYAALCTLLEVQELLDKDCDEGTRAADEMLRAEKAALLTSERELRENGQHRKAQRITCRRVVLEIEVAKRSSKSQDEVKNLATAMAVAMGLQFTDVAPPNVEPAIERSQSRFLLEGHFSAEMMVVRALRMLSSVASDGIERKARIQLAEMSEYARELTFRYVAGEKSPVELNSMVRHSILSLFLDDFALDFADINGYLEAIVGDYELTPPDMRCFGSKRAHRRLSLAQLELLQDREPALLESDVTFALRYLALLQLRHRSEQASQLDMRDDRTRESKLAACEQYLSALSRFTGSVNCVRTWVLHEQLQAMKHHSTGSDLKRKLFEYLELPRFGSNIVTPSHLHQVPTNEFVIFSEATAKSASTEWVGQPPALTVTRISSILGDHEIGERDDYTLIQSVLFILWTNDELSSDDEVQLRKLLKDMAVDWMKAQSMIRSGRGDVSDWKEKLPRKGTELLQWSAKTKISFCESNALYFAPEDEMSFHVNVRNVKTLTVQVYEVRTVDYYVKMRSEVQGDICLDGLLPNEEQRIDLSHLKPWQKARVNVKIAPEARGRRGVFVVEVFEKDTTCRAILRKGYLRHVQRVTSRGIEFVVLNEQGEPLNDASLMLMNLKEGNSKAQPPRTYSSTDGSGTIVIPFREPGESSSDKFGIIFCYGDFGHLHRPFDYTEATYSLTAQMHIDSEQLRPGDEAKLFVKPLLCVGSTRDSSVSIDVLKDVNVVIQVFASAGATAPVVQRIVKPIRSIHSLIGEGYAFTIPMDADALDVEVTARVTSHDREEEIEKCPLVRSSARFKVQHLSQFHDTHSPHFFRRQIPGKSSFEYYIAVLGHNGEPIPRREVAVTFELLHSSTVDTVTLQTDDEGELQLGSLESIVEVRASFVGLYAGSNLWRWEVPNTRVLSRPISCTIGETVRLALPSAFSQSAEAWLNADLVVVCRSLAAPCSSDAPILEVLHDKAKLRCMKDTTGDVIAFELVLQDAGDFVVYVRPLQLKYYVKVCRRKEIFAGTSTVGGFLVEQKQLFFATPPRPLMILGHQLERNVDNATIVRIQLENCNPKSTVVWIFVKQFLDQANDKLIAKWGPRASFNYSPPKSDPALSSSIHESEYLKRRKISDEYLYILQRRAFQASTPDSLGLLGAPSLPKPTLLQTPHVLDESDMDEVVMRGGESVSGFKTRSVINAADYGGGLWSKLISMPDDCELVSFSSISFLAKPSACIGSSSISPDGQVNLCMNDHELISGTKSNSLELVIIAFDYESNQVASREAHVHVTSPEKLATRDVRLGSNDAVEHGIPSMQLQSHEILCSGQSRTLPRSASNKFALYETLGSAMDLWCTLCPSSCHSALTVQLRRWLFMKPNDKIAFYMKNASDDLNIFIFHKGPAFFLAHIRSFITAKLSKSLVDLYVLEETGSIQRRFLLPGVFQKLSIIEKLLVAERVDSPEHAQTICQHVIDIIDGSSSGGRPAGSKLSRIFATVLSQGLLKPAFDDGDGVQGPDLRNTSHQGAAFVQSPLQQVQQQQQQQQPRMMATRSAPMYMAQSHAAASAVSSKPPSSGVSATRPSGDEDVDDDDTFPVVVGDQAEGVTDSVELQDQPNESEVQVSLLATKKRRMLPYLLPGKVRRVQEKRYFTDQKPHLDGRNMFWRDYATYLIQRTTTGEDLQTRPFLSSHFPEALRSFTEGIFALSLLNLAMDEVTHTSVRQLAGGLRVELNARSDVILYHQGIGPAPVCKEPNSVLIMKQRLLAQSDLASASSRDFVDIRPAREFVVNRIYSCVVSVCNIGSTRLQNVNLLRQIPRGAVPLTSTGFYTKNEVIEIAPHDTKMYTCDFYFPHVGSFTQYPAHASLNGEVISWASADDELVKPITVVLKATAVDLTSWNDVAARGSLDDVISFMSTKRSVVSLGLESLAWRCREEAFYRGLVSYLRQRWVFVESIWKYAFLHSDFDSIRELCSAKDDFVRSLGSGFSTSIVELSDIYYQERFDSSFGFDHTEFGPLLARRAHHVAGKVDPSLSHLFGRSSEITASDNEPPRILHKKAREYYRTLCQILSLRASISTEQLIVVAYFLILFNRVSDALKVFDRVRALEADAMRDSNEYSVAADYIDSYLDFFRPRTEGDAFPVARRNAAKYKKLANDRWRERFVRVQELLDEYDDLQAAAKQAQTDARSSPIKKEPLQRVPDDGEVRLKAEVKADEIHFTSQHLGACEVSFYRIDVELMFSTEPFDSFSASAASRSSHLLIQPWKQMRVDLLDDPSADGRAVTTKVVRLTPDLAACPMLLRIREVESTRTVETIAEPIDLTRSYFNSRLQVVVIKQAGLIQVLHNGLPVPSCYIKAYAKLSGGGGRSGRTQFYKDGYTDVIGKFDYAAINGDLLSRVEKFSLLVSHPTLGTTVEQVSAPVLAVASSEFEHREANEALWF